MAELRRRDLFRVAGLAGVGAWLVGCEQQDRGIESGTPRSSPAPSGTTSASLPRPTPWTPSPRDVSPQVKTTAVRMVEAAGTWAQGDAGVDGARRRLQETGYNADLARSLVQLTDGGQAAVVQVIDAQYGGILSDAASVLTVVRQWVFGDDGAVTVRGTTLDVRLVAGQPRWVVTAVRPARPGRPIRHLSRAARALLANDRVVLPAAATADVRAGAIDDVVLLALASLSARHRIRVSVLRSGHPLRVFGTDRISNHTQGLAVDVWELDNRPIIDSGITPAVADFMKEAVDVGAYQVGGPVDLDGGGVTYFSDDTHQDHIHLGFTT